MGCSHSSDEVDGCASTDTLLMTSSDTPRGHRGASSAAPGVLNPNSATGRAGQRTKHATSHGATITAAAPAPNPLSLGGCDGDAGRLHDVHTGAADGSSRTSGLAESPSGAPPEVSHTMVLEPSEAASSADFSPATRMSSHQ